MTKARALPGENRIPAIFWPEVVTASPHPPSRRSSSARVRRKVRASCPNMHRMPPRPQNRAKADIEERIFLDIRWIGRIRSQYVPSPLRTEHSSREGRPRIITPPSRLPRQGLSPASIWAAFECGPTGRTKSVTPWDHPYYYSLSAAGCLQWGSPQN